MTNTITIGQHYTLQNEYIQIIGRERSYLLADDYVIFVLNPRTQKSWLCFESYFRRNATMANNEFTPQTGMSDDV